MIEINRIQELKRIIWDLDCTVWLYHENEIEIMMKTLGIPNDRKKDFSMQYIDGLIEYAKYFKDKKFGKREYLAYLKTKMPILSEVNFTVDEFFKIWLDSDFTYLNEGILEIMRYTKEKGYKNIAKSDFLWERQMPMLRKFGLLSYIDVVYTCDGKYLKNNPKSVDETIEKGEESKYIIIGDSLGTDIAFAKYAGIKSVWYNPEGKENDTEFKPTVEIQNILELYGIL